MMKKLILGAALAYACAWSAAHADSEEKVLIDPLIFTTPHLALREGVIDEFSRACDEMDGIINASSSGSAMNMACKFTDGSWVQVGWVQDQELNIEVLIGWKAFKASSYRRFESIIPCAAQDSCDAEFIVTRDEHEFGKTGAKVISIKVQPRNRPGLHIDGKGTVKIIGR